VIRVRCPACGHDFEFADFLAGLTAVCKDCGHRIPVPRADAAIQPLPASQPTAPPASDAIQPASGPEIQSTFGIARSPLPPVPKELPETRPPESSSSDATSLPEWAIERAKALLRTGATVPEIEQQLIVKGLSPEAATAITDRVLEEQTRQQVEPQERAERRRIWHRALSAVVAVATVFVAWWFFGGWSVWNTILRLLLPVACIWFSDELGGYASRSGNKTGTGILIRWCAWVLLLLIGFWTLWLGLVKASLRPE
jgi:hypothetical protein